MSAAGMSPERRAELMAKPYMQNHNTRYRTANPAADADLAALRKTERLSPGVWSHERMSHLLDRIVPHIRADYADDHELEHYFTYEKSSMTHRPRLPWRAGGYDDEELRGHTEARFLTPDRLSMYQAALENATRDAPGTVDVILVNSLMGEPPWSFSAFPTIPSVALSVRDHVGEVEPSHSNGEEIDWDSDGITFEQIEAADDAGARELEAEDKDAYSVLRVARLLLGFYATQCIPCDLYEERSCSAHAAALVGRGQRVLVMPMCVDCHVTFFYSEETSHRIATVVDDDFIDQVGWPRDDLL